MKRADLTLFIDGAGAEHVAIVTDQHPDGTVDLAVLKTTLRGVPRSGLGAPHSVFDHTMPSIMAVPTEETDPGVQAGMQMAQTATESVEKIAADVFRSAQDGSGSEVKQEEQGAVETTPDQGPVSGG